MGEQWVLTSLTDVPVQANEKTKDWRRCSNVVAKTKKTTRLQKLREPSTCSSCYVSITSYLRHQPVDRVYLKLGMPNWDQDWNHDATKRKVRKTSLHERLESPRFYTAITSPFVSAPRLSAYILLKTSNSILVICEAKHHFTVPSLTKERCFWLTRDGSGIGVSTKKRKQWLNN